MRWFVLCLLLASIGCRQSSAFNPFNGQGPTTITPPSTGTAGRTDPYYRKSLSSNVIYVPAQTVFTSDLNPGGLQVADERGNVQAGFNDNTSKMQWRSPGNDGYPNESFDAEVVGTGRARPRLPSNRRIGQGPASSAPSVPDEPMIIDPNAVGASGELADSYQGLPPTPQVDRQVAPATFQQSAPTGASWQSRY